MVPEYLYKYYVNLIDDDRNDTYCYPWVLPYQSPLTVMARSHQSGVSRCWEGSEPVGLAAMGLTHRVGMPGEGPIHLGGDIH